eukprot:s5343_g4.t1
MLVFNGPRAAAGGKQLPGACTVFPSIPGLAPCFADDGLLAGPSRFGAWSLLFRRPPLTAVSLRSAARSRQMATTSAQLTGANPFVCTAAVSELQTRYPMPGLSTSDLQVGYCLLRFSCVNDPAAGTAHEALAAALTLDL